MLADYLQSGKLLYLFMEKEKKSNQRSNLKEETLENSGSKDHFTNPFSREVWETTYKGPGEVSVEDTWARVAQAVASPESGEESQNLWKDRFYNLLYGFKFIPGGRILANAGIAGTKTSLVNCFVSAFPKDIDIDSLDGIMWILTNQAKTLKAEGGWGMNCSWLRPRGAYIKGINSRSPGAVKYLELFDKSSEIITEGPGVYDIVDNTPRPNEKKKIRKGAMMLCMSCWHGDLLEFIQAKQKPNHLTKMNISVCLTDKFMDKLVKIRKLETKEQTPEVQAEIKELDKWDLVFPDTEHPKYSEWDGNLDLWESKGYPIKVYRHASVREIWDMLMRSTYNRNDPGVIFIDRVNRTHCAGYIEDTYISSSNPCLAEGSLVDTPDGERLIETIKEGDAITTMHSNGYEPVTSIEVHHDYPVNKVVFADGTVHRATDGHIYWTWNPGKQEIDRETRLKDLMPGASVVRRQGDGTLAYVPIVSIEPDGKATVYDLYCKESDSWCVNGFVQRGCGEQFLISSRTHGGGSCNLGSLNLTQYVKVNKDGKAVFDFKAFAEDIPAAVRFLDNVIQIANMPLEQYTDNALKFRRIGMGVMGVGSMLAMLGIPFNDPKAYELLTRILTVYNVEGVKASLRLGREKGAYYACNAEKHYEILHKALKLDDSAWKEIDKVYDETGGTFRNSALFSIQPTGNTGVLANMTSGGLEPIFNLEYVRTAGVATVPDYIKGKCPRYWEQDFAPNEYFKQVSVPEWGIEYLEYKCPEDGETYKIFKDRGLCKDVYCCDYSVQWLKANGKQFKPESILTAMQLTPKDHLDSLQTFAEHLDSSASKCVAKGTLITTDKGVYPIESFSKNNSVDTFAEPDSEFYVNDENGDKQKITKHYYGGKKPCKKLTFSNGFSITCTEEHAFKTSKGFIKTKYLEPGNRVWFRNTKMDSDRIVNLPDFEIIKPRSNKYYFNLTFNNTFAEFLGMWLADGFTSAHSIGIVEKDSKVGEKIDELFLKIFGVLPSKSTDKRSGVVTHMLHSRELVAYFRKHFGHNCANKFIPEYLLQASNSVLLSLLNGLTLDGYASRNRFCIYEGYSKDITIKCAYICNRLGIRYHLGKKFVRNGKLSKYSFSLWCEKNNLITPIETHKALALQEMKPRRKYGYIDSTTYYESLNSIGKGTRESYQRRNLRNSWRRLNSGFIRTSFLDSLNISYDPSLEFVDIINIEDVGLQEVYDIEVEHTHSYTINGIICHNTINLPTEITYEDFKDIYLNAYKGGYIKGVTTYRDGTMAGVLNNVKKDEESKADATRIPKTQAPKRPKTLECRLHLLKIKDVPYYAIVSLFGGDPYEVFIGVNEENVYDSDGEYAGKRVIFPPKLNGVTGSFTKKAQGKYEFKSGDFTHMIVRKNEPDDMANTIAAFSRILSCGLRHGTDLAFMVEQLEKTEGSFTTPARVLARALKKYIPDGKKVSGEKCPNCGNELVRKEGCKSCANCGWSACG